MSLDGLQGELSDFQNNDVSILFQISFGDPLIEGFFLFLWLKLC